MTTHGETLSTITTPTKAVTAAPRLRELTYRYQPKHAPDGEPIRLGAVIRDPKTSAAALMALLHDEAVEVFGILCLTTKHRIICWHEVGRGSLDSVIVMSREVFKPAIMTNAAAIIAGHYVPRHIRQSIFCPAARRTITRKQATDDPPRRWAKEALD